jgi:hypothetical protein
MLFAVFVDFIQNRKSFSGLFSTQCRQAFGCCHAGLAWTVKSGKTFLPGPAGIDRNRRTTNIRPYRHFCFKYIPPVMSIL